MQQLSLLPSSSANPLDGRGHSVDKSRTENDGFKNTFDEVERSLEGRKPSNHAASRSASIDQDDTVNEHRDVSPREEVPAPTQHQASLAQEHDSEVSANNATDTDPKSGTNMPAQAQPFPPENGNGLPVSVETGLTGTANLLQQAISAVSGAKGEGIGLGVLQAGLGEGGSVPGQQVSTEALAGAAVRAGSLMSTQAQGGAGLKGAGAGNFGFAINGVLQADTSMSETANAKLTDLAAKAAASVDAPERTPQAGRPPADNLLTGSAVAPGQGGLAGFTGMRGAVSTGSDGLPPQAQSLNAQASNQANEAALSAANTNARFNRTATGVGGAVDGLPGLDSSNGMQPESESLFKATLETVQSGRGNVSSEATELGTLKVDPASVVSRTADVKAADAQAPNVAKPYVSSLGLPVDDNEWSNQLGQKLMWMNARNIQTAELHLNPADLGPIDVRIHVSADQSSISFNTQNQNVRELLEANIHRLREMLNNPGQSENSQSGGGAFAQDSGTRSQGQSGGDDALLQGSLGGSRSEGTDSDLHQSSKPKSDESAIVDAYV